MSEEQRQTFQREVEVQIDKEGRTLISRLVPYNEVATVNDGMGPYQEMFVPGAFDSQMRAAHRIKALLNFRHRQSLSDVIDGVTGGPAVHQLAVARPALVAELTHANSTTRP